MTRWKTSDWTLCILATLAVLAAWEGFALNHRPETHGCGGDFPQYYIAGKIVAQGHAARLYDQPYFRALQEGIRDDPLRSLYPPTMALIASPLGMLSYNGALAVWWAIHAICIVASGAILYRMAPPGPWRIHSLVALAALLPLWIAVGIGHLAPVLLLVVAGGMSLHRGGRRGWAGLLLSLLALKPQLAVGLVLWMLVRRDVRTLLALAAGFSIQAGVVAAVLGIGIWFDFLHALPGIAAVTRAYRYSPLFEQSFAGIASNLLWMSGFQGSGQVLAMKIVHILAAGTAAILLCRVVGVVQPWRKDVPPEKANYEYACGLLFMIVYPPYFLVYDLTLLAVPLIFLWSSPAWRMGTMLFVTMTTLVANLSFTSGFSLTPLAILASMLVLAVQAKCTTFNVRTSMSDAQPTVSIH